MTAQPEAVDIYGEPYEPDLPELVHLGRAVEVGGEGGSLTLLGPAEGQTGEFMIVRQEVLEYDEDSVTYGGATLIPAGTQLIAALDQLQPFWREMVGVYVAPHFEAQIRTELGLGRKRSRPYDEWRLFIYQEPLTCLALFRNSTMWPDRQPRDAFWLEGTIDHARALLGRLPLEHQEQLQDQANKRFAVVVSRDGTQRYAMPYIEGTVDDPWPPDMFEPITQFIVEDIGQLRTACLPDAEQGALPEILNFEAAQRHYETLRARYPRHWIDRTLREMAEVTWPFQVMLTGREDRLGYAIMIVRGQGMEEDLWFVDGEENDAEAVQLSVVMRNMLFLGNADGHPAGYDSFLHYAIPLVREVNRLAVDGSGADTAASAP